MNKKNVHELLERLNSLFKEINATHTYQNTYEISKISKELQNMKLSDSFLIKELSEPEQKLLDIAIIIAQSSK